MRKQWLFIFIGASNCLEKNSAICGLHTTVALRKRAIDDGQSTLVILMNSCNLALANTLFLVAKPADGNSTPPPDAKQRALCVIHFEMKTLFLIFFAITFLFSLTFAQTREQILKFKIYKVFEKSESEGHIFTSMRYYDLNANEVMSVSCDSTNWLITTFGYKDSFQTFIHQLNYRFDNFLHEDKTLFDYTLDSSGNIIQSLMTRNSGDKILKTFLLNIDGRTDTSYRYIIRGNSKDRILTECCSYSYIDHKTISICHDSLGWNSPYVQLTEYKDSLDWKTFNVKKVAKFNSLSDSIELRTVSYRIDDRARITEYIEKVKKVHSKVEYYEDSRGLEVKSLRFSNISNSKPTQVTHLKYYVRH